MDGAIWLRATFPAGFAKTDLRLRWTPSLDDGQLVQYDVYMANAYHDSYFVRVGSVPTGDPDPEIVLRGGAIAGSPETVVEGPVALRYPRDAYFTVVGRDANGGTGPATFERVGKFTIDLPAEWVLLSLPLIAPTTVTPDVFAPIEGHWDIVRHYDAPTGTWKTYRVGGPNTLPNVNRTMGLWLGLTGDAAGFPHTGVFTVVGDIPQTAPVPLYYGGTDTWNQVGYPYLTAQFHDPFGLKTVGEALLGICWKRVETYDPTAWPYYLKVLSVNDLMLPGLGYWVVNCAATWTLVNTFPPET